MLKCLLFTLKLCRNVDSHENGLNYNQSINYVDWCQITRGQVTHIIEDCMRMKHRLGIPNVD